MTISNQVISRLNPQPDFKNLSDDDESESQSSATGKYNPGLVLKVLREKRNSIMGPKKKAQKKIETTKTNEKVVEEKESIRLKKNMKQKKQKKESSWRAVWDEQYEEYCYVHVRSGAVTWDIPYKTAIDKKTGRTYYYNAVTRESTWERPVKQTPKISNHKEVKTPTNPAKAAERKSNTDLLEDLMSEMSVDDSSYLVPPDESFDLSEIKNDEPLIRVKDTPKKIALAQFLNRTCPDNEDENELFCRYHLGEEDKAHQRILSLIHNKSHTYWPSIVKHYVHSTLVAIISPNDTNNRQSDKKSTFRNSSEMSHNGTVDTTTSTPDDSHSCHDSRSQISNVEHTTFHSSKSDLPMHIVTTAQHENASDCPNTPTSSAFSNNICSPSDQRDSTSMWSVNRMQMDLDHYIETHNVLGLASYLSHVLVTYPHLKLKLIDTNEEATNKNNTKEEQSQKVNQLMPKDRKYSTASRIESISPGNYSKSDAKLSYRYMNKPDDEYGPDDEIYGQKSIY